MFTQRRLIFSGSRDFLLCVQKLFATKNHVTETRWTPFIFVSVFSVTQYNLWEAALSLSEFSYSGM